MMLMNADLMRRESYLDGKNDKKRCTAFSCRHESKLMTKSSDDYLRRLASCLRPTDTFGSYAGREFWLKRLADRSRPRAARAHVCRPYSDSATNRRGKDAPCSPQAYIDDINGPSANYCLMPEEKEMLIGDLYLA